LLWHAAQGKYVRELRRIGRPGATEAGVSSRNHMKEEQPPIKGLGGPTSGQPGRPDADQPAPRRGGFAARAHKENPRGRAAAAAAAPPGRTAGGTPRSRSRAGRRAGAAGPRRRRLRQGGGVADPTAPEAQNGGRRHRRYGRRDGGRSEHAPADSRAETTGQKVSSSRAGPRRTGPKVHRTRTHGARAA